MERQSLAVSGAAGGRSGEGGAAADPANGPGGRTMQTAPRTSQRHADTYLTHLFGGGPGGGDRQFVVERFRSTYDGEIKPVVDGKEKGGRSRSRRTVSLRTVRTLRPAHDEIIIATSVSRDAGIQLYGATAAGFTLRGRWR